MSNQPTPALPVLISSLNSSLLDQKLRVAGRFLSYDYESQLLLIQDEASHACLVDVTLVLEAMLAQPGLRESKATVTISGYLERVEDELPIPTIPAFVDAPMIDSNLVIRAIVLAPSPDLDLAFWRESIRQREHANIRAFVVDL
ncbi:hypothetical protein M0805_006321 [Coniferiporia weirii]|nr:hypothetical protein M0805_006321 [Coniferiporia weirii]